MGSDVVRRPRGRPSVYTADLADRICARLAAGESIRSICRDPAMPGTSTVMRWKEDDASFRARYAYSREAGLDAMAEEALAIADDTSGDPARDRLRVDTRKWLLSKMAPRRYGERVTLAGDEDAPMQVVLWGRSQ